jgi:hypothetical protein
MKKIAENGRKVKALLFSSFLPIYEKWEKSLKMDEKLTLLFCCFLPIYEKLKRSSKMDETLRL